MRFHLIISSKCPQFLLNPFLQDKKPRHLLSSPMPPTAFFYTYLNHLNQFHVIFSQQVSYQYLTHCISCPFLSNHTSKSMVAQKLQCLRFKGVYSVTPPRVWCLSIYWKYQVGPTRVLCLSLSYWMLPVTGEDLNSSAYGFIVSPKTR